MKIAIRRIGNSLGVLLPKATLAAWKLREGDFLRLTERGIRPGPKTGNSQTVLDELKRSLALAVVRAASAQEIRAQSLGNLHRWKKQGTWGAAYEEWRQLLKRGDDGELYAAMLGRDEHANRLRQSMPFVGLLSQQEVARVYEEAGA